MLNASRVVVSFHAVLALARSPPEYELPPPSVYASRAAAAFFRLLFLISTKITITPNMQNSENNNPIATLPASDASCLLDFR
ncbi:hypothetical protein HanRHA438_Chr14g0658841 [Helianthus annuus]|nr:hypothetical protein HanHA300_Chr14g0527521 [Helianthus annuus]KAJ0469015.1 hypothetical protein HanIR_Chr14g0703211 [Helianthus annuus]KAJ0486041.1 hypothetical protein HanHA89_Chr14g0575241 [Helianthus annuus]KAJ0656595.1 hypothetical protein HanLR1_Chr14g0537641 [Helianthus annuus]KAJ0703901.1 hypothetical protein HanPI659440_Chr14g0556611 [Helianthus annuus]